MVLYRIYPWNGLSGEIVSLSVGISSAVTMGGMDYVFDSI